MIMSKCPPRGVLKTGHNFLLGIVFCKNQVSPRDILSSRQNYPSREQTGENLVIYQSRSRLECKKRMCGVQFVEIFSHDFVESSAYLTLLPSVKCQACGNNITVFLVLPSNLQQFFCDEEVSDGHGWQCWG